MTDHSAAGSALGYLYQCDWALLELLRRGPDMPDAQVSLELFDDVAWTENGTPTELLQLKHHLNSAGSLTDKAEDLWRTIRVWMDGVAPTDPDGPALLLTTTATATDGTGVFRLRPDTLDLPEAQRLLEDAAGSSTNAATADVRERFLALSPAERQAFVSRIRILDGSPSASDVSAAARKALVWAIPRGHDVMFMEMLWGWWRGESLAMLRGTRGPMGAAEVQDHITEIRDQFTSERLPTVLQLSDVDPAQIEAMLGDYTFVAQLRLIDWPEQNLQRALIDYYRATVHQKRWVDEDLIGLDEILRFHVELIDEWKSEFEFMRSNLANDAPEADLKAAGVTLLRKLLDSTTIRVRPRYEDAFFARGVRHELADQREAGWHPNFEDLLVEETVA